MEIHYLQYVKSCYRDFDENSDVMVIIFRHSTSEISGVNSGYTPISGMVRPSG